MGRLEGKRVFLTGGAKGIGRAAALLFAAEGARVAIADIDEGGVKETVALADAEGGEGRVLRNRRHPAARGGAGRVGEAAERFGGLDVLYNNAGGATPADGPVTEASVEEFWRAIGLDLFGTFLVCKYGLPHLIAARRRIGGQHGVERGAERPAGTRLLHGGEGRGRGAHAVDGGGIRPEGRSRERAGAGGRCAPRAGDRDARTRRAAVRGMAARHLVGLIEPEDVARLALYLASDESARTTGQVIAVDSGFTIN